eukprot:scaffold224944_cov28-Prasinocladus_malaysianus.AAC.1
MRWPIRFTKPRHTIVCESGRHTVDKVCAATTTYKHGIHASKACMHATNKQQQSASALLLLIEMFGSMHACNAMIGSMHAHDTQTICMMGCGFNASIVEMS